MGDAQPDMLVMMIPGITSYQSLPAVQPTAVQVSPTVWMVPTPTVNGWVAVPTVYAQAPSALTTAGDSGNGGILDALAALVFGDQPQSVMSGMPAASAPVAAAPAPAPAAAAVAAPVAAAAAVAAAATPAKVARAVATTSRQAVVGLQRATGKATRAVATGAKRVGTELWAGVKNPRQIHVTQVPSKFNPHPAAGNRDCGPASVVMALRLLGEKIPGLAAGATPQSMINRIRALSGNSASTSSTSNSELEQALSAAGTSTTEITTGEDVKAQVMAGHPVILNGNPRNPGAYGPKFSESQMTPYNGAHWILVSGYDKASGEFLINDPLSKVGVVKVTAAQLEAYRGGSMGIAVEG